MELSINRLIKLIKRDWIVHKKFALSFVLLLFLFGGFVMWAASDVDKDWVQLNAIPPEAGMIVFVAMLFVGGSLLTLLTFSEFKRDTSRLQYLGLPASNLEKMLSKWLYTLPGFLLFLTVLFFIVYWFFGFVVESYYDVNFVSIGQIDFRDIQHFMIAFLIAHSFFFLMAVLYNKYTIPKTILTAFGLLAVTVIILGLIFRIVFFDHWEGFYTPSPKQMDVDLSQSFKDWAENFFSNLQYVGVGVIVPFMWVISYFKMKEKEA